MSKSFNRRENYFNIDRQDKRVRLNISDDESSEILEETPEITDLNKFLFNLDKFKYYPSFLKSMFKNLAKKYAAIKCTIKNITNKKLMLSESLNTGTLPPQFKHQQKFLSKLSDIEAIRILTEQFVKAEQQELELKLNKANDELANRYVELKNLLTPIIANTTIINEEELRTNITLDSLIEQEFCIMLTKMEQDKIKRMSKQEKLLIHKEKLLKPADITQKEFNKLKKELRNLKINKEKSKNGQGKPIMKKLGPSQNKQDRKPKKEGTKTKKPSKNSRKDGNTKNTVAKRQ